MRFSELQQYYKDHGHTAVKEKDNHQLHWWIHAQRKRHRAGKLHSEKANLLQQVDQDWCRKRRKGNDSYCIVLVVTNCLTEQLVSRR
jgi:hypothetical protein